MLGYVVKCCIWMCTHNTDILRYSIMPRGVRLKFSMINACVHNASWPCWNRWTLPTVWLMFWLDFSLQSVSLPPRSFCMLTDSSGEFSPWMHYNTQKPLLVKFYYSINFCVTIANCIICRFYHTLIMFSSTYQRFIGASNELEIGNWILSKFDLH